MTLEHVAAVIKKDPMFDFLVHLVEGVGLETSIGDIPGITKSVKAVKESDDFKERDQITKMMKLKTKKSNAQGNSSSHTESKGLSEASWSRCTSDRQLTMQILPVSVENQIAVPAVSQIRIGAQLGHLDEDNDS